MTSRQFWMILAWAGIFLFVNILSVVLTVLVVRWLYGV